MNKKIIRLLAILAIAMLVLAASVILLNILGADVAREVEKRIIRNLLRF